LTDTLRVRTITLAEALDTTETAIDVSSGHGAYVAVDDIWQAEETGELILVTAHSGTDTITTVIRNYTAGQGGSQGTASVGVTTATNLKLVGTARLEGADSTTSVWVTPAEVYNYSQIMHHQLLESGSSRDATTRYGIPNWREYEIAKLLGGAGAGKGKKGRAGSLLIDLEKTFFSPQVKTQRTASVRGIMAGARTLITTNDTDKGGATLTQEMLEDLLATVDGYGGKPDTIICNQFQWRLICSWFKDSVHREEGSHTGGVIIDTIRTVFGDLNVMYNRWCPRDELYVMNRDNAGWVTLRDWAVEPLGKTGDANKEQIVGEFGFVLKNELAAGLLYDLAYA
jgi:hypothetical protein